MVIHVSFFFLLNHNINCCLYFSILSIDQVPSLQSISRLTIFSLLRSAKLSPVKELYLPNILKDYLSFRHFHFVTE